MSSKDELSEREIELIGSTWAIAREDPSKHGQALLIQFFQDHPEHKKYFAFRNVATEDLPGHTVFQEHSVKVMNGIGKIIDAIQTPDAMIAYLHMNAENHRHRNISQIAYDDLRQAALTMMANELGPNIITSEVGEAYNKALKLVFKIITDHNESP